jgi:hypothetical protein
VALLRRMGGGGEGDMGQPRPTVSERRKDALQLWLWMADWKAADEA